MFRFPSGKIKYIIILSVFLLAQIGFTQTDTLVIATYNLLNYPGTDAAIRNPHFRAVIHSMKPDVLFVQEMISQTGVNTFLNDVMNKYQANLYASVPFNDGPDTDNSFFYRTDKITFLGAYYINTALRRIAEYTFRHNNSGEVIRVYSLHLKAAQGYEQERLAEATILRNYLNNLPAGTNFIVGGDFNIYTSSEPAFQKLIGSESDNDGRCFDPINAVGDWNNNYAFRFIHTQSTRVRSFGGGATGGLDDRFDMQLVSESLLDNIIVSSYKAYGNDGNHFNDSINRLPNYAVPDSVANGLHYTSDHLPVVAKYVFTSLQAFNLLFPQNNSTQIPVNGLLKWSSSIGATAYDVYLSTSNPPTTIVSSNQTDTTFSYSNLTYNANYYWKVVAKNSSNSLEATGSPFKFTTIVPAPPSAFTLISPENNSLEQPSSGTLSWNAATGASNYDVYLDTVLNPITIVSSNQTNLSYLYQNLIANKTYYWKVVAKNEFGSIQATNSPFNFTIANVPLAPSNLSISYKSFDRIQLVWEDNSQNELGYRVYRITDSSIINISGNLPPNTTEFNDSGLVPNTLYIYKVLAFNGQGEGNFDTTQTYTLAQPPLVADRFPYGMYSIVLYIDPVDNPSYTQYAVMVTDDMMNEKFVQNNKTLGLEKFYQNLSFWHASGGIKVINLTPGTLYYIKIIAKNEQDLEVQSLYDTVSTGYYAVTQHYNTGWNLVSNPVLRSDRRKISVFPTAISKAFAYYNGYSGVDTLENGLGYWLKFHDSQSIDIAGTPITLDTFYLSQGWNLIGSISDPVSINNIIQIPENLIISSIYNYDMGYSFADSILPGRAYWLKAISNGTIILNSTIFKNSHNKFYNHDESGLNRLIFKNEKGEKQTLYFTIEDKSLSNLFELPPPPPQESFDVRFENSSSAVSFAKKMQYKIFLKSQSHSIKLEWEIKDGSEYFIVNDAGDVILSIKNSGSATIGNLVNSFIFLKLINRSEIGKENLTFQLYQNYPNPFNPSTKIKYSIDKQTKVKLIVYNTLGQKVAQLVDAEQIPGLYEVEWIAENITSGVYYYKIETPEQSVVKKLILMR